jgi:hypothetical protein
MLLPCAHERSINDMAHYALNDAAVAKARERIDARQYVLDSDWGDVQPRAEAQNAYLDGHSWQDYASWHLGLTEVPRTRPRPGTGSSTVTSGGCTAPGSSPACTGRPSGGTRTSKWPPTTCCSIWTRRPV